MEELKKCPYCNSIPAKFSANVVASGCTFNAYIIECDNDEGDSVLPFIEHRLSVYGVDERQATERWNKAITPNG